MFNAEKEQSSNLVGIIYGIAIVVAVGAVFLLLFPEIAGMVGDAIKTKFSGLLG